MIEELHNFKTMRAIPCQRFIDDNIKMVAFNFGKRNGQQTFFKMMVNIFELIESKHLFIDKIRDLIKEQNYKDVSALVREICNLKPLNHDNSVL